MVNWERVINEMDLPDLPPATTTRSFGTEIYISGDNGNWQKLKGINVLNVRFEYTDTPRHRDRLDNDML